MSDQKDKELKKKMGKKSKSTKKHKKGEKNKSGDSSLNFSSSADLSKSNSNEMSGSTSMSLSASASNSLGGSKMRREKKSKVKESPQVGALSVTPKLMDKHFSGELGADESPQWKTKDDNKISSEQIAQMEKRSKAQSGGFWNAITTKFGHMRDSLRSSSTLDKFKTDHVIMLTNKVAKKCLRVTDCDQIDCKGNPEDKADEQMHFLVRNYGWNVVSLKSMTFPLIDDKFLCVRPDGKLYSDGSIKSNECRFRLHETDDNFVTFESYVASNHHLAFSKKGDLVSPYEMPEKDTCTHFSIKIIRIYSESAENTGQAWELMH